MEVTHRFCQDNRLRINVAKTKCLRWGNRESHAALKVGDEEVEEVDSFKYLGLQFTLGTDMLHAWAKDRR